MSLEQLMAFTVTTDHARQEQVWEALQRSYSKEPYQIRRMLTESARCAPPTSARCSSASTPMRQAGGVVMRDLFQQDDGGWLRGCRPARPPGRREAEGRGRGDRRRRLEVDRGRTSTSPTATPIGLRELDGDADRPHRRGAGDDRRAERRIRPSSKPNTRTPTNCPTRSTQRLGEIETALAAFEDRPVSYDPAEIARAGVFVSIDCGRQPLRRSRLCPARGRGAGRPWTAMATPEPTRAATAASRRAPVVQRAVITIGGQAPSRRRTRTMPSSRCPDRLVSELTAHRTLALRDARGEQPACRDDGAAAQALPRHLPARAHRAAAWRPRCGMSSSRSRPADLKDSPSAKAIAERHEAWKADLPKDEAALWDWLAALDDDQPRRAARALRLVRRQCALREGRPLRRPGRLGPWRPAPARPGRPARARRRARHGRSRLAADGRQLSRPRHQAPHPRGGARGEGRAVGAAHRPPEEGRHGEGSRTAAGRHRLAARAAAPRRRPRPPTQPTANRRGRRSAARLPRRRRGRAPATTKPTSRP